MNDSVRDKTATLSSRERRASLARSGAPARRTRGGRVAVLVHDGVTPFELGIACDVFGDEWAEMFDIEWYRLAVCSLKPGPVRVQGGFRILTDHGAATVRSADTVIVLPTISVDQIPPEVPLLVRQARRRGARIVGLCTGTFALGEAGLLDGIRATTHWTETDELASRYPEVSVEPGVLFVDEDDVLTSAGSAASMDLCLHIVRKDYGSEVATQLARQLVVPPQREGGQAQFIEAPISELSDPDLFTEAMTWIQQHIDEPVSVEDLAARSAMSSRTFARRFHATRGTTPYQWLLRQRIALAQRLLESTDLPVDVVAQRSGFSTAANLRKHFGRVLKTSPLRYRQTFRVDLVVRSAAPHDDAASHRKDKRSLSDQG